jgi:hypothetical protein
MEITGILVKQTSLKEGVSKSNGNPWKIAEYLVETPGQYPRKVNFKVSDGQQGRIARFDSLIGKTVTVSFDIDAREYEGRWYNEINAWGVMEYITENQRKANIAKAAEHSERTENTENVDKADELPF